MTSPNYNFTVETLECISCKTDAGVFLGKIIWKDNALLWEADEELAANMKTMPELKWSVSECIALRENDVNKKKGHYLNLSHESNSRILYAIDHSASFISIDIKKAFEEFDLLISHVNKCPTKSRHGLLQYNFTLNADTIYNPKPKSLLSIKMEVFLPETNSSDIDPHLLIKSHYNEGCNSYTKRYDSNNLNRKQDDDIFKLVEMYIKYFPSSPNAFVKSLSNLPKKYWICPEVSP